MNKGLVTLEHFNGHNLVVLKVATALSQGAEIMVLDGPTDLLSGSGQNISMIKVKVKTRAGNIEEGWIPDSEKSKFKEVNEL